MTPESQIMHNTTGMRESWLVTKGGALRVILVEELYLGFYYKLVYKCGRDGMQGGGLGFLI